MRCRRSTCSAPPPAPTTSAARRRPSTQDGQHAVRGLLGAPAAGNLSLANSDVAFQGNLVYQGTFPGFRIVDVTNAMKPKESSTTRTAAIPPGRAT